MQDKEKPTQEYYPGSILLSDGIKRFVQNEQLIVFDPFYEEVGDTFDEQQLDRAKYNVRLGRTYYKADEFGHLDDKNNPLLVIEPYELVFIESYEVFKMPKNVVAMYDLRIGGCLGGLGLQTGLHIDPTYYGRVVCPLFNFSDQKVTLKYKDQLASVQFIYTTPPTAETKDYGGKQNLFSVTQALLDPRSSGLGKLWTRLQEFESEATRLHTRVDSMVGATFEGMAFMIAALGVVVAAVSMILITDMPVSPATVGIGVGIVILVAGVGFYRMISIIRKIKENKKKL